MARLRTRVALVCVDLQVAAGELEVVLGNDLVECKSTTREVLAYTTVATVMSVSPSRGEYKASLPKHMALSVRWKLGSPCSLATMALSVVRCHIR